LSIHLQKYHDYHRIISQGYLNGIQWYFEGYIQIPFSVPSNLWFTIEWFNEWYSVVHHWLFLLDSEVRKFYIIIKNYLLYNILQNEICFLSKQLQLLTEFVIHEELHQLKW